MRPASPRGQSQRPLRVGEGVRHALADILSRNAIHDLDLARHNITVTEVRMSPDLRHATVFVTPLGGGDPAPVLAELRRCNPRLRTALAHAVRLRYAPELHFQPDPSFDYAESIGRALRDDPLVAADLKKPLSDEA